MDGDEVEKYEETKVTQSREILSKEMVIDESEELKRIEDLLKRDKMKGPDGKEVKIKVCRMEGNIFFNKVR